LGLIKGLKLKINLLDICLMALCLAGTWTLRKTGSDHVPGIESVNACPLSAKLRGEFKGERFNIQQLSSGPVDEVQLMLRGKSGYSNNYYQLGKLNFEKKNVFATIVGIDKEFKELSILRIGPAKAQRSLEQYTLDANKREIRLEIDMESDFGRIRMVKYLVRSAESADVKVPPLIKFRSALASNYWKNASSHSIETIQEVTIQIQGTVLRIINTRSGNSVDVESDASSTFLTKATETKRYDSAYISDEKVMFFAVKVSFSIEYRCVMTIIITMVTIH
jgi:hypothetical protein